MLALALLLLPAAWGIAGARTPGSHEGALASGVLVYLTATLGVTALGNFPVPVMGAGAGPILGWYTATGLLVASCWRPAPEPS